jgi:uncharacterized protein (TIGR04255 family)
LKNGKLGGEISFPSGIQVGRRTSCFEKIAEKTRLSKFCQTRAVRGFICNLSVCRAVALLLFLFAFRYSVEWILRELSWRILPKTTVKESIEMEARENIVVAPVVDFVFDVWFEEDEGASTLLFGKINILSANNGYSTIQELPILGLPKEIREKDQFLKGQPWYALLSKDKPSKLFFAPGMFGLALAGEYAGWSNFYFGEIRKVFGDFFQQTKKTITRIGLRYVDFLEGRDIFIGEKVQIKVDEASLFEKASINIFEMQFNGVSVNIGVSNAAQKNNKDGSIVDVTTFISGIQLPFDADENYLNNFEDFCNYAEHLHKVQLDMFKQLMDDNLLRGLGVVQ